MPTADQTSIRQPLPRRIEVVIVGSGAGGGTLAHRLASQGRKVLLVEGGDFLKPTRAGANDPVSTYITKAHGDRAIPLTYVGGQTKFYGAALYRFRESDFREVRFENGVSPAWPVSYADLEPYYEQAEALYRVHGAADNDATEPPRSHPFPYPPPAFEPLVATLAKRLAASGAKVTPIPRAIDSRGGQGKCVLCTGCDAYFCQVDGKMDTEIAAIRPALATGNLQLATRTLCLKVLTTDDGKRVRGVVLERDGEQVEVMADTVVVSAGLGKTAELLRRSRTGAHPEGLGNDGGALGRYLGGHSTGMIFPFVSLGSLPPVQTKSFAINQYYQGSPGWDYPTGVIQLAGQMPFWDEASRLVRPIARIVGQHAFTCFYMTEALPTRDTGFRFDGEALGERVGPVENLGTFEHLRQLAVGLFKKAGYRSLARKRPPYMWHEVGTARMGDDPATSVVDPNCQVHGVKGLFAVDASVLPSAGAVNTGLTIMALALRCGDHIAGKQLQGAVAAA